MILILYLAVAVMMDLKFFKIPNCLCFFMLLTGIYQSYIRQGVLGIRLSLFGILFPFLALYLLFYIGGLGAGDIKLFCAIGSFLPKKIVSIILLAFLFNGVLALWKLNQSNRLATRFCYFRGYVRDCLWEKKLLSDYEAQKQDRIHFSLGILLAVICVIFSS